MIGKINSSKLEKRKETILSSFMKTVEDLGSLEEQTSVEIAEQEAKKAEIEKEISALSNLKNSVGRIKSNFKKLFVE